MDFTNRNQQTPARPGVAFSAGTSNDDQAPAPTPARRGRSDRGGGLTGGNKYKWYRWGGGVVVIIVGLLLAAVIAYALTAKPSTEDSLVDGSKLQAVFLTNDQVYFGNVTALNKQYVVLQNIYYLQSSSSNTTKTSSTNSNVSLVKLGCELHKPYDQMVINRSEVEFWENLKSDGQVAKAVAQYQKANPNGQTCSTTPSSNPVQGSSTGSNSDATTNNTTTNNTSTNGTKQ